MKISSWLVLLIFCGLAVNAGHTASARDDDGCLTCHQYPGLVKVEKNHEFTVLHIDEASYVKSPHGKLTCRKCHTKLNQIPHTGETRVECNSECHLSARDKELLKNYDFRILHRPEQSYITILNDNSSCRACHALYPHDENKMVRAFLNMHTGFMYCEACHVKRDTSRRLSHEWVGSENVLFVGEPFGTRFDPHASKGLESGHFISRLGVFELLDGQRRSLINTEDVVRAREFMAHFDRTGPEAGKAELDYFHRDIARKEISVACDECHSATGILDFKRLGFDEKKAGDLVSINIKGLVTKYKTFYFPGFLPR